MKRNLTLREDNMPQIAKEVSHICDEVNDYKDQLSLALTRCAHGLGHALMFVAHDNLPSALALCDNIRTTKYRAVCYRAVFMQNASNFGSFDHPNAIIKEDPLYPCPTLDERYQHVCYTNGILMRHRADAHKSIEICGMVPKYFREECFMNVGGDRVLFSDNIEVLKGQCASIKEKEYHDACIVGVAGYLVVRYSTKSLLPFEFCSVVEEGIKGKCYGTIGQFARSLIVNQNEIIEFCNKVPEGFYRTSCMDIMHGYGRLR